MINYILLIISIILFLIGIKYSTRNGIITKSKSIIISMIATCFLSYSFFFLFSDYITGNGVDYPVIYFLNDTFVGIGFRECCILILLIISIGIINFILVYSIINRFICKTGSKRIKAGKLGLIFYLFALLSLISSPTTYGYFKNIYMLKSHEIRDKGHKMESKHEVNRFIAHAGGKIEGYTYTNSLEALNLSYKIGFRLFELDIIKTADSVYVAAHEWEHWQEMTGYKGEIPPNRATFKQQQILEKYTPLDIDDINDWFKDHPDAILVTDKINSPSDFSKLFIDKNRLMMELFTLDAVKEAVDANIKSAMPSWSVVSEIKGNKVQTLVDLGVTDIAASRRVIKYNIPLIKSFTKAGIKIYVFHVNHDKGKDEAYVVRFDMDYIYGLYADEFDLSYF